MEKTTAISVESLRTAVAAECEAFVEAHYADLFRWFLWLSNRTDFAADWTQETFARFWDSLDAAPGDAGANVWLFAIGRNVWRHACRSKRDATTISVPESLDDLVDSSASGLPPPVGTIRAESAAMVRQAVAELPVTYREAVSLRYWQDLKFEEIAQVLEVTVELARWRVFQGRRMLRSKLASLDPTGEKPC